MGNISNKPPNVKRIVKVSGGHVSSIQVNLELLSGIEHCWVQGSCPVAEKMGFALNYFCIDNKVASYEQTNDECRVAQMLMIDPDSGEIPSQVK